MFTKGVSPVHIDNLLPTIRRLSEVADSKEVGRAFRDLNKRAAGIVADDAAPRAPIGANGSLRNRAVYKPISDRAIAGIRVGTTSYSKRPGSAGRVGAYSGILHYGTGKGLLGKKRKWLWLSFERRYKDVSAFYQTEIRKVVNDLVGS